MNTAQAQQASVKQEDTATVPSSPRQQTDDKTAADLPHWFCFYNCEAEPWKPIEVMKAAEDVVVAAEGARIVFVDDEDYAFVYTCRSQVIDVTKQPFLDKLEVAQMEKR